MSVPLLASTMRSLPDLQALDIARMYLNLPECDALYQVGWRWDAHVLALRRHQAIDTIDCCPSPFEHILPHRWAILCGAL